MAEVKGIILGACMAPSICLYSRIDTGIRHARKSIPLTIKSSINKKLSYRKQMARKQHRVTLVNLQETGGVTREEARGTPVVAAVDGSINFSVG